MEEPHLHDSEYCSDCQTNRIRIHLRHTGQERFQKPRYTNITRTWDDGVEQWGHNFTVGRWVLVIRRGPSKKGFFDLEMGRAMLRYFREEKACPWPGTDHYFGLCACPNKSQTHPSHITYETRMRDHILNDHRATLHPPGYGDGKAIGGTDEDAHLLHSIYFPNCQENP